jgi:hypothetical protein
MDDVCSLYVVKVKKVNATEPLIDKAPYRTWSCLYAIPRVPAGT